MYNLHFTFERKTSHSNDDTSWLSPNHTRLKIPCTKNRTNNAMSRNDLLNFAIASTQVNFSRQSSD